MEAEIATVLEYKSHTYTSCQCYASCLIINDNKCLAIINNTKIQTFERITLYLDQQYQLSQHRHMHKNTLQANTQHAILMAIFQVNLG